MRLGDADPGSNFKPDGTITIFIANNKVGNPAKGDLLGSVTGRTFAGNGNDTVRTTAAIDLTTTYSLLDFATYLLNGNTCVELVVSKTTSVGGAAVRVGQNLTYTVQVINRGRTTATGVVLTDDLPPSMTFVSATTTQGACSRAGTVVTCNLGNIAGNSLATVKILVRPTATGVYRNLARVRARESDRNPATDSDSVANRVIH
jgi:uncharacterized repeat protein (TIGR01451 family)